jgi:AAA+ ATPase superfamily predicted ATPase
MARTAFKGRNTELSELDKLWDMPKAALMILYGRRRVGKTRLLTHWREQHADQALYWVAEPMSARDQLRSFSQALHHFSYPDSPVSMEVTYNNWEQAFWHVAEQSKDKRLALFIDEFTYLLEVEPSIVGTLQKAWDHWLSDSNLILALSGSQMALMRKHVLAYEAPLYGRATSQFELRPLPYSVTKEFFPRYTPEDRVSIYAIFGGIPAYWERIDDSVTVVENIREQLLTPNTLLQEEPRLLLQDFISDQSNYVGIMGAIARGERTNNAISNRTGLPKGHVSKYLSVLRNTGFVERRIPVTDNKKSRRGRYFVTDPYLRFYYHFLAAHQAQLVIGAQQQALRKIEQTMPLFTENNTWQELSHEWLLRASDKGDIPLSIEEVGSSWSRSYTYDVVGINKQERSLVLGVCSWQSTPIDSSSLRSLVERTTTVLPDSDGEWSVYFLGFAKDGWTEDAHDFAKDLNKTAVVGESWRSVGIRLLDLDQVDSDLIHWSAANRLH